MLPGQRHYRCWREQDGRLVHVGSKRPDIQSHASISLLIGAATQSATESEIGSVNDPAYADGPRLAPLPWRPIKTILVPRPRGLPSTAEALRALALAFVRHHQAECCETSTGAELEPIAAAVMLSAGFEVPQQASLLARALSMATDGKWDEAEMSKDCMVPLTPGNCTDSASCLDEDSTTEKQICDNSSTMAANLRDAGNCTPSSRAHTLLKSSTDGVSSKNSSIKGIDLQKILSQAEEGWLWRWLGPPLGTSRVGWLLKRSPAAHARWQPRWFVLSRQGGELSYYKRPSDCPIGGSRFDEEIEPPLGKLQLGRAAACYSWSELEMGTGEIRKQLSLRHCELRIVTPLRTWRLRAACPVEANNWAAALERERIASKPPTPPPRPRPTPPAVPSRPVADTREVIDPGLIKKTTTDCAATSVQTRTLDEKYALYLRLKTLQIIGL